MIFFNFNYWATLSSKIMSNFLIVIHYMYFQNTMVSFEYTWVGNDLYIFNVLIFENFDFLNFQHLATDAANKFERLRPGVHFFVEWRYFYKNSSNFSDISGPRKVFAILGLFSMYLSRKKYSKILVFLLS